MLGKESHKLKKMHLFQIDIEIQHFSHCHISPTDGSLRRPLLRPATAGSLSADPSSLPVFSSRHGSPGPGHGRQSGLEAAWPRADAAGSQVRFVEVV